MLATKLTMAKSASQDSRGGCHQDGQVGVYLGSKFVGRVFSLTPVDSGKPLIETRPVGAK